MTFDFLPYNVSEKKISTQFFVDLSHGNEGSLQEVFSVFCGCMAIYRYHPHLYTRCDLYSLIRRSDFVYSFKLFL
jgi:hypothetical protein